MIRADVLARPARCGTPSKIKIRINIIYLYNDYEYLKIFGEI